MFMTFDGDSWPGNNIYASFHSKLTQQTLLLLEVLYSRIYYKHIERTSQMFSIQWILRPLHTTLQHDITCTKRKLNLLSSSELLYLFILITSHIVEQL